VQQRVDAGRGAVAEVDILEAGGVAISSWECQRGIVYRGRR
jgi:hypothetical protein